MIINGFDWSGKKVLVTGASGFKGSWLCAALNRLGARVFGTVRNQHDPFSAWKILQLERDVVNVQADVSDRQDVYDTMNAVEPDVVFHLAAKALVPVSLRDPRRTFDVNIMGTLNIIEAARKLGVCERLLICSTDHVFGNIEPEELPEAGFQETSRVSYGGPYDTSKAAMELLVRSYHYTYWNELPAIGITRCANVFGYGDTNQRRVIPLFVSSAAKGEPVKLKYRKSGRQFLHVTDAVVGYLLAATTLNACGRGQSKEHRPDDRSPFTPSFHFSIEEYPGTTEPFIRMEALARLTAELFDTTVDDTGCIDFPLNENKLQALNCAVTRAALDWRITKPLAEGMADLGRWYQSMGNDATLRSMMDEDLTGMINTLSRVHSPVTA